MQADQRIAEVLSARPCVCIYLLPVDRLGRVLSATTLENSLCTLFLVLLLVDA